VIRSGRAAAEVTSGILGDDGARKPRRLRLRPRRHHRDAPRRSRRRRSPCVSTERETTGLSLDWHVRLRRRVLTEALPSLHGRALEEAETRTDPCDAHGALESRRVLRGLSQGVEHAAQSGLVGIPPRLAWRGARAPPARSLRHGRPVSAGQSIPRGAISCRGSQEHEVRARLGGAWCRERAARGKVVGVVTGAKALDWKPGGGFGNHVLIEHANHYFTLYAHLDEIHVSVGDEVGSGKVLGTMGDTGQAGNRHVHFSLHRAPSVVADSVPIHGLVLSDVSDDGPFILSTSLELECANEFGDQGRLYGSENDPGRDLIFGPAPDELMAVLRRERTAREEPSVGSNQVESIMKSLKAIGAHAAREKLEVIVHGNPDDRVALYWIVVLSVRDLDDLSRARSALAAIEAAKSPGPSWMDGWVLIRKSQLAERDGHDEEARAPIKRARTLPSQSGEYETFLQQAEKRLGMTP
jgi:hypothetical protein